MILRTNEIDPQFIGLQVLEYCPSTQPKEFADGFLDFVNEFLEQINFCSMAFGLSEDSFMADLPTVIESTFANLEYVFQGTSSDQAKNFWSGAMTAAKLCEQMLQMAYETHPSNKAA